MTITISGQDLIDAGLRQGRWFKPALEAANSAIAQGESFNAALAIAAGFAPPPALALREPGELPFYANIEAETPEEEANVEAVKKTMTELLRTPVVTAGAIMPDACPSGPGSIPVGGVVSSTGIHPGFHSADICCSMAITVVPGVSPGALLDAVHKVTHFGPGGRERGKQIRMSDSLLSSFDGNEFLKDLVSVAREHYGTQGDGNHFAYVGQLKSTGETALVTHHGSRAPGAKLYAKGMKLAESTRRRVSPETLASNAWIEADTRVINPASRRVLEKSGFRSEGSFLKSLPARGGLFPCEQFRLDRSTWSALKSWSASGWAHAPDLAEEASDAPEPELPPRLQQSQSLAEPCPA